MNKIYKSSFLYITILTLLSIALIFTNFFIGMLIPFDVSFLIGYVMLLLVFVIWDAIQRYSLRTAVYILIFTYLSAFAAEMLGVNFGLIFGEYYYTKHLGVQILGVPLLAGTAWGPITYAAYHVSEGLLPTSSLKNQSLLMKIWLCLLPAFLTAIATTAWDLSIDAIAVDEGWWVWKNGGHYLSDLSGGIPISNFVGWLGLSTFIQLIYRLVIIPSDRPKSIAAGPIVLYLSLFLTSFSVVLTTLQRPDVALIGLMSMGPFALPALRHLFLFFSIKQSAKPREI
ncbi:MAG: carotenoid biosynthesis protein [Anaerolineaceae bacterium]|nr:carotenoid biosynthesis protein [Anaerolineaceae bacterium]